MSATLSYELKKGLAVLSKEHRWDVLTVLILHANIRNRCWVSTDTICEMATNGNRNKTITAKRWLEKHKTLEIVTYNKRVDEEKKLKPRQHVYQLLGKIEKCEDLLCDCQKLPETVHYLYINSIDGETFKSIDGETFKSIDGETRSIPNEQKPKEVSKVRSSTKKTPLAIFREEWDTYSTYGNELLKAFSSDFVGAEHQSMSALKPYLDVAKEFTEINVPLTHIPLVYRYVARIAKEGNWSTFGVTTLSKYYSDFLKAQPAPAKVYTDPAMDLNVPQPITPILIRELQETL